MKQKSSAITVLWLLICESMMFFSFEKRQSQSKAATLILLNLNIGYSTNLSIVIQIISSYSYKESVSSVGRASD